MARWFGLSTLDFALMAVDAEVDEIPLGDRSHSAESGPAFVTRAVEGHNWAGSSKELDDIENPGDISKLVVFDTWTSNCDRYRPEPAPPRVNRDNVFLSKEGTPKGRARLLAIDHTHCFTCGRELNRRIAGIEAVECETVFGLFPEFRGRISRREVERSARRLKGVEHGMVHETVRRIPREWDVKQDAREALVRLICGRARYVADTIVDRLRPHFRRRQSALWDEEEER